LRLCREIEDVDYRVTIIGDAGYLNEGGIDNVCCKTGVGEDFILDLPTKTDWAYPACFGGTFREKG
jgi:hypothetical protein